MNAPDRKLKLRPAANKAERGVGARTPLVDGIEKVTGTARYTADLPANGALVGKILRSPYAHAELLEVALIADAQQGGFQIQLIGDTHDAYCRQQFLEMKAGVSQIIPKTYRGKAQ